MQIIEISNEAVPGDIRAGSTVSHKVEGRVTRSGDIEIVRVAKGDKDSLLTVIPKNKRAELAHYLVNAQ